MDGSSVRRPVAEQAAAAAGAAHLRRGCAGGSSATHEIVDLRCRYARRQPLSVLPFGGNLAAHLIPVAPFERVTHRHSGIANPFETVEYGAIAVEMPFDDFPVVRPRVTRQACVCEHQAFLEGARIDVEADPLNAADAELDRRDATVKRRTIVLNAGRHPNRLALDVHRDAAADPRDPSERWVHCDSAPHAAIVNAEDPAMPAPAGDSPRVMSAASSSW